MDVFDISGNLLRTSNYVKNFITNSGTLYPYYFAFADCFRYLSLGTGTGKNSTGLSMAPTTGLNSGVSGFQYLGSGHYTTGGFLGGGCGNSCNPASNTITLIRQWGLPDTTGGAFTSSYNFSELMVTPGKPYVSGWNTDGTNWFPSGACSCEELVWSVSGGNGGAADLTGKDCSQAAYYYGLLPNIGEHINNQFGTSSGLRQRLRLCDAPQAFARITGNFYATSGEVLAITYQLNLSFSSGINTGVYFSSFPTGTDRNWNALGFANNMTNPGIKLIVDSYMSSNNSSILAPNGNPRLQQLDYINHTTYPTNALYGESFTPSVGMAMEPSCIYDNGGNFIVYVSDDNSQFMVSPSGGPCNTGLYKPWNSTGLTLPQNSGLMKFQTLLSGNTTSGAIDDGSNSSHYWMMNPYNIRTKTSSASYPNTGDVSSVGSQIPNTYTGAQSRSYFTSGTRGGSILTNYNFPNFATNIGFGAVQYVKSFVIGYVDAQSVISTYSLNTLDTVNPVAIFDCLFSGLSGSGDFIPTISTGNQSNSTKTKIVGAGKTDYNYLTGQNGSLFPTFQNLLSWTADCPSGVDGC